MDEKIHRTTSYITTQHEPDYISVYRVSGLNRALVSYEDSIKNALRTASFWEDYLASVGCDWVSVVFTNSDKDVLQYPYGDHN